MPLTTDINPQAGLGLGTSLSSITEAVQGVLTQVGVEVPEHNVAGLEHDANTDSLAQLATLAQYFVRMIDYCRQSMELSTDYAEHTYASDDASIADALAAITPRTEHTTATSTDTTLRSEPRDAQSLKETIAAIVDKESAPGTHGDTKSSDIAPPAGDTHTSAVSGLVGDKPTNLTAVPPTSPTYTPGPSKPVMDVIEVPASGPAAEVLRTHEQGMRQTYPNVPVLQGKQIESSELLKSQAQQIGSKQPGSLHLTDRQARQLSEAIAHNINVRRAAEAQRLIEEYQRQYTVDAGNYDSFGGTGAGFVGSTAGANSYQEAVLMLAQQVVDAQIPYAWGGGSLDGPSQGTTDGGYADACGDYAKIGFDCSGWARYCVYQASGGAIELPRVSQAQYSVCTPVAEPEIGDLGFPPGGSPGHVVVYVGGGQVCEAQQSGTNLMFSPASGNYVWGRVPGSPNGGY